MTDSRGLRVELKELMQDLQQGSLSDWSKDEIDGFIVDAYLSLKASLEGRLRTIDGLLIEPDMDKWGVMREGATCQACLAGGFFVGQVGTRITDTSRLHPFDNEGDDVDPDDIIVLTFLDGLRYLEEGGCIHDLLCTMGYGVPPASTYDGSKQSETVLGRLYRFIGLNPRLTQRLQEHTYTAGGEL